MRFHDSPAARAATTASAIWCSVRARANAARRSRCRPAGAVAADDHGEVVELEDSDRVSVGVQHVVVVVDPLLPGARQDDGLHYVKFPCSPSGNRAARRGSQPLVRSAR